MQPAKHFTDIQSLLQALRRQQVLSLGLGVALLILAVTAMNKSHTVVLEPPSRARTISQTGDRVDGAWLEEMGGYVATMLLDASPASIGWQHEQILRWTHPSRHGQLQQDLAVAAKRLIESNAAQVFWLQQIAADPERQRVVVVGQLDTLINGVKVAGASKTVSYLATFESRNGRVLLRDWKETPNDDVWLSKLMERLAREAAKPDKTTSREGATK